jgi:dipeptidyl aminopeptidase/acylaminoacyl peptidase
MRARAAGLACPGLIALLSLAAAAARAAPPAAEAFAAPPQMSVVTLSPDGRLLAWRDAAATEPQVVVYDIAARRNRRVLRLDPDETLHGMAFADDATLLLTVSFIASDQHGGSPQRSEYFRTLACDVGSGATHVLLMEGGYRALVASADLILWHMPRPHTVVMSSYDYDPGRDNTFVADDSHIPETPFQVNLFDVDTRTGEGRVVASGNAFVQQWVVDANGAAVARAEWRAQGEVYSLYARSGSGWREILHLEHRGAPTLHEVSPDGRTVYAIGGGDDARQRLWAIPLDGSPPRDLTANLKDDVVDFEYDPLTGATVGARTGGLMGSTHWIDRAAEQRQATLEASFPGRAVALLARSQSGSLVVAQVQDPSHPPVFYLVDFGTHRADIIGEAYPALDKVALGRVRAYSYRARDGTEIPAYLTLPPGGETKNLPLVVLPHGGPAGRDYYQFDWGAQFLAVRGYAVLQPEFRGSTGFGAAFQHGGERQWGGVMQDDVTDGVQALVRAGVVDRRRVCIVGTGYGGYAALAGAAFTPELYACAVSIGGVADLPAMDAYLRDHGGSEPGPVLAWRDQIGAAADPTAGAKSPVRAAQRVQAAVLLLYTADDQVVPPSQSQEMARALTQAGKKVRLVKLPGDDHWLSRTDTRVAVLEQISAFLADSLH